ncbi:MAG: hypothetical protein HKN99_09410 [Winogradskyella sp.]|nr:hypothetical protein [Winogradskyella sp.]
MKIKCLIVLLMLFNTVVAQEWMSSFAIAQKLALTQNKMLFVMWEGSIEYPLPVIVIDENGNKILVEDLFESEGLNTIIWENFVPVLLNETEYDDWYEEIKSKRSYLYKEKFDDDSIKIMDANGNMLSTAYISYDPLNFTAFVKRYSLDTSFLEQEIRNYQRNVDFYSAFYLGSKYVDYAIYTSDELRLEIIKLSQIYLEEAEAFLELQNYENENVLKERLELVKVYQELILNKPRKVIRKLKKLSKEEISDTNKSLVAFLYYTAYKIERDQKNVALWKTEVSLVNLKQAHIFINSLKK